MISQFEFILLFVVVCYAVFTLYLSHKVLNLERQVRDIDDFWTACIQLGFNPCNRLLHGPPPPPPSK